MTQCPIPYAIPITHIWPVTHEEELASDFPDKAFYYPRQTGFSFLFIRFVIFSQCLLGWAVCEAGIIRDGTATGTHLIWRSLTLVRGATQTHTRHHKQAHTPEEEVAGSRRFRPSRPLLLCSFKCVWNLVLAHQSSALTVNGFSAC